jgi:hypothetical protein
MTLAFPETNLRIFKMKNVQFDLSSNKIYYTYSQNEYDRFPIDSILFKKCYNKITQEEWERDQRELLQYKRFEMVLHKDSMFT